MCTALSLLVSCKLPVYFQGAPGLKTKQQLGRVSMCTSPSLLAVRMPTVLSFSVLFMRNDTGNTASHGPALHPLLPRRLLVFFLRYLFVFSWSVIHPAWGHHAKMKRGGKVHNRAAVKPALSELIAGCFQYFCYWQLHQGWLSPRNWNWAKVRWGWRLSGAGGHHSALS